MLKIVLDTNMFVSGFIFQGMAKVVFDLILENKLQMHISTKLKEEVTKKFESFSVTEQGLNEVVMFIENRGILVDPNIKITG